MSNLNLSQLKSQQKSPITIVKQKKIQRISKGTIIVFAKEHGILLEKNYEAIRKDISKQTNRHVKIWLKIFFNKQVVKKSKNSRMGKGKSKFKYLASRILKNQIIFEISTPKHKALFRNIKNYLIKMPFKVGVASIAKKHFIS